MADSNPTLDRLTMALTENGARAVVRVIFQMTTENELIAEYEGREGRIGDPIADLLAAELQARDVDF